MDSRTFLIALLFGAFAAGLAVIGFSAQEKYLAYRAEQTQVRSLDPEPAASAASRFSLPQLPEMSAEDRRGFAIGGFWGLFIGSHVWLLVTALQVGALWGAAVFFGSIPGALVFLFFHPAKAVMPVFVYLLSWALLWGYRLQIL